MQRIRNTNAYEDKEKRIVGERHRHRYEFNDEFASDFEKAGMIISRKKRYREFG